VMLRDIDRLREQLAEHQESVLELAPIVKALREHGRGR